MLVLSTSAQQTKTLKGAERTRVMPDYLSLTLLDGYGRETVKRIEMTPQILLADYVNNANLILTELDAITDLQILRANLVLGDALNIPAKDPSGSNVDVGATFSCFLGEGDGKKGSLKVPGIKMGFVGAGGFIDLTDADIAAYLDLYGDPPNNKARLSDGEYAESWIQGTLDK